MKKLISIVCLFTITLTAKAQFSFNPEVFLNQTQEDAQYLAGNYLKPLGNTFTVGLNNGWYQTAKTKKKFRPDLMFTPSIIFVPQVDQSFTINNSELNQLELSNMNMAETPTVFGDDSPGPELKVKGTTSGSTGFNAPSGIGYAIWAVPMATFNIGTFKNTDLAIRYLPEMGFPASDGKVSMFGVGVKHDLLQWLPGEKIVPFDLSAFVGFTNFDFDYAFNSDAPDQRIVMSSNAYTGRLLVSKKILFITPYAGLGFNAGKTTIDVQGDYSFDPDGDSGPAPAQSVNFDAIEADGGNGFVGNVGVRLKFLFVMAFSVDYTFGAYNSVTAGLGASIDL